MNNIEKELYIPESSDLKSILKYTAPFKAYVRAYKDNGGLITDAFYNGLFDYIENIDRLLIDLYRQKENSIPIEKAEEWLQHRLMTDISEVGQYLGNH